MKWMDIGKSSVEGMVEATMKEIRKPRQYLSTISEKEMKEAVKIGEAMSKKNKQNGT